jgi:hypothetical protein
MSSHTLQHLTHLPDAAEQCACAAASWTGAGGAQSERRYRCQSCVHCIWIQGIPRFVLAVQEPMPKSNQSRKYRQPSPADARGGNPMTTSRRTFVKGTVATAAAISAPGLLKAQSAPTKARTIRAVLHGDLKIFDPIWTTANMTGNHGLLIYDTLFGLDDNRKVQPQMVDKWASPMTRNPIHSLCAMA